MCEIMERYTSEARLKGRAEGKAEIISRMLKNGKSIEEIADFCSIPLDEVKEVQNELLQTV
jgi:predicted transposase/invertase (TIGR01784 family)